MSHFAASRVLENMNSSGLRLHKASAGGGDPPRLRLSPPLVRFAPGFSSENLCTRGNPELRIVDPPSVAAAAEIEEEDAV